MHDDKKDILNDDLPELTDITDEVTVERENHILDLEDTAESTSGDELTP